MNILHKRIHLTHVASYDELETVFDLITYKGAKTLMLEDQYGLGMGKPTDFIVLNETSAFERSASGQTY